MSLAHFLWVGVLVCLLIIGLELLRPTYFHEGFEVMAATPGYFSQFLPPRGDIGPETEEGGFTQDPRYFHGYANVQRMGVQHDYCRMVIPETRPDTMFFACALAGTEHLSSVEFRTPSTADGFQVSRDDYMRDMNHDGREEYCRILKTASGAYQALCSRATDTKFDDRLVIDTTPPDTIRRLLGFYEGCVIWYRFRDDMVDYVKNTQIASSGKIQIQEIPPNPVVTKGIQFNGVDQFLRIGDSPDLELGYVVPLQSLRAVCCWAYFDSFTNNAHLFDFGDGAGRNNLFLGILGRGDATVSQDPPTDDTNCASGIGGPQPVVEMSPQELLRTSRANVDEFTCMGPEMVPRRMPASRVNPRTIVAGKPTTATLVYEVWDAQQRKMQIRISGAIPLRKWTHIVITAADTNSFRPAIQVYINGALRLTKPSGHLPQVSTTTNNYFGKSNWANDTSQYDNKDELFHGSMFDFRGYKAPVSATKVVDMYLWGREMLGLEPDTKT